MSENDVELKLPSDCTVGAVTELKSVVSTKMKSGGDIVFDAQAVEAIDTAGLQLLLSIKNSLAKEGWTLGWVEIPEILTRKATLSGFGRLLEAK